MISSVAFVNAATMNGARQALAHTHLVRGGFVMLKPTRSAVRLSLLLFTIWAYPRRETWVRDARAYKKRCAALPFALHDLGIATS